MTQSPYPERFPVSLRLAAEFTGRTPEWIADYIRVGALPCAIAATDTMADSVWLSVEDVRKLGQLPQDADSRQHDPFVLSTQQDKIVQVCRVARALFDGLPPVTTAMEAILRKTGVVIRNRHRQHMIAVRASDVSDFAATTHAHPFAVLAPLVRTGLIDAGADEVRGIKGLDDESQHWGNWLRLPHSLAAPSVGEDSQWRVDFPALRKAEEDAHPAESPLFTKSVD